MIYKMSFLKRFTRSVTLRLFNYIENNGDCNFNKNGEKFFLNKLFNYYNDQDNKGKLHFFDVGGNIGEYSELLANFSSLRNLNTQIHTFEPTKACFDILKKKFSNTSLISLNNVGLSEEENILEIHYDKEMSGLASLHKRNLNFYNIQMSLSESIKVISAKSYIENNSIAHISFMKIDIEGHELNAFRGFGEYLSGDFIDFIQFEYGGANLDSHTSLMELYDFLESKNFVISKVMPEGLEIRTYRPYMENFNYSNYVAISKKILNNNFTS